MSYTQLLIREPLNKETPPGGGGVWCNQLSTVPYETSAQAVPAKLVVTLQIVKHVLLALAHERLNLKLSDIEIVNNVYKDMYTDKGMYTSTQD